jgi:hypothetical protein
MSGKMGYRRSTLSIAKRRRSLVESCTGVHKYGILRFISFGSKFMSIRHASFVLPRRSE